MNEPFVPYRDGKFYAIALDTCVSISVGQEVTVVASDEERDEALLPRITCKALSALSAGSSR